MKAMILAAGLGTRLKPLTDVKPKALLSLGHTTLLGFAIQKLKSAGFNELIINVHHFAPMIVEYLKLNNDFGCKISISDESDALLDTGGGISKASWFFDDGKPFLVYNADIVGNMDLTAFYKHHLSGSSLATLSLRERKTSRYLLFDQEMRLCGWENTTSGEKRISIPGKETDAFAFSGIHAINPEIFALTGTGSFSIIDSYLGLARQYKISGWLDQSSLWADAGKPESLELAGKIASQIVFE
ncbi:MAG: nucleotidyltransferase family protein [Lentimicrobium sp.]|nr:nucleotidyltransferase family protein [Lentimicrobium sp.]